MPLILGISGSLRNARFGAGEKALIEDIEGLRSRDEMQAYLEAQTRILLTEFFEVGRREKRPFTELYYTLRKAKGDRGLSNSEAQVAAGLWAAHEAGAAIDYCSLANHFPPTGEVRDIERLREKICASDALLLAGPVYFGDRGSLVQRFFEFLHADQRCRAHVRGKLYAGLTVGAKRNGGQETTLIYQMVDAVNLSLLAVGNDHETTAQYGGTAVAGDVGTFSKDAYGIDTSVSTGRRLAKAAIAMESQRGYDLTSPVKVGVWLLQDEPDSSGLEIITNLCNEVSGRTEGVDFRIIDFTKERIYPCIACDICPTDPGLPEEYRCIIVNKEDAFKKYHQQIRDIDAFLLAAYSPKDRSGVRSVYQAFIERTRYLRRDDYMLGDRLAAPLVISQVNANQNLHIRMLTSAIRHHSILHHPLLGFEYEDRLLNYDDLVMQSTSFVEIAKQVTVGRLRSATAEQNSRYNPVGYIVSAEKQQHDLVDGLLNKSDGARSTARETERDARTERAVG